jgi:hypothetical protein
MAKRLKASVKASRPEKVPSKKLSLYPLDLGTALGAALRAGPAPKTISVAKDKQRKSR